MNHPFGGALAVFLLAWHSTCTAATLEIERRLEPYVALGYQALTFLPDGAADIAIGREPGAFVVSGYENINIGCNYAHPANGREVGTIRIGDVGGRHRRLSSPA